MYSFTIEVLIVNNFLCRWYHGRLDRYSAELRLQAASKLGSYLIRESDRKPGSYVLSYLGHTGINHFRYYLFIPFINCFYYLFVTL